MCKKKSHLQYTFFIFSKIYFAHRNSNIVYGLNLEICILFVYTLKNLKKINNVIIWLFTSTVNMMQGFYSSYTILDPTSLTLSNILWYIIDNFLSQAAIPFAEMLLSETPDRDGKRVTMTVYLGSNPDPLREGVEVSIW